MKHIFNKPQNHLKLVFNLCLLLLLFSCKKDKPIVEMELENMLPMTEEVDKQVFSVYIEIEEEEIPIDDEIPCNLVFIENEDSIIATGKIGRRGGISIVYNKHSYKIDLKGDYPIAGLPADDDWILNANHIDKSFMRHTLSYELFKKMNPANNIATNWKYVEVYLNQQYTGLYVLMERLDRSTLMIEKPDTAACIYKEPPLFRDNWDEFVEQDPSNYHRQTYPDIEDFDKTGYLHALRNFILNTSDTLFSEKIDTIFDIDNIIDWHLLLLYSNNGDGILKNFYLYRKSKNALAQIAPWDYDHSFGRYGEGSLNLDKPVRPERANLLNRLLKFDWYTTKLKKRWLQLNDEQILGVVPVSKMIDEYAAEINLLVERNFEVWSIGGWPHKDDNNLSEEIEVMKQYLNIRQGQLETYFNEL